MFFQSFPTELLFLSFSRLKLLLDVIPGIVSCSCLGVSEKQPKGGHEPVVKAGAASAGSAAERSACGQTGTHHCAASGCFLGFADAAVEVPSPTEHVCGPVVNNCYLEITK